MKKRIGLLLGITLGLASCGGQYSNISDLTSSSLDSDETTTIDDITTNISEDTTTNSATTTDSGIANSEISLKMYGNLYINGTRTIYANIGDSKSKVVWTSSEPSIVSASVREDLSTECTLIAKKVGSAVISASLSDDSSVVATMKIDIEEGTAMPIDKFSKLQGGLKLSSVDEPLSFDKYGNSSVDSTYDIVTIFEESGDVTNKTDTNSTDAYSISAINRNNANDKFERTYVKTVGSYVGTEYLDMKNKVNSQKITNESGETIKFDYSYYTNLLNSYVSGTQLITPDQFRTYDGGKTYHYSYSYINSMYLAISYFGLDLAPDDMWFTFEGDNITLNTTVDPYNNDVSSSVKYGRQIKSTISEIDTAKIQHVTPYAADDSQIPLKNAINSLKQSKNYKVNYVLDYAGTADDTYYEFIITEDTIDQKILKNGTIVSHTGAHASSNTSYFQYEYDDSLSKLTVTKEYDVAWDAVNRYPDFEFSSEIFEKTSTYEFTSRSLNGAFITRALFLSSSATFYKFEQEGTITLNDEGQISKMKTIVNVLEEDMAIDATFTEQGKASVGIDFSNFNRPDSKKSFEESNPTLAENMRKWQILDIIPFLDAENGYNSTVGSVGYASQKDYKCAYITTNDFNSNETRDAFITAYRDLLIASGFVATGKLDPDNKSQSYTKDGYTISVGAKLNWNGVETKGVKIVIYGDKIVNGINL